jgi:hypothetical protein
MDVKKTNPSTRATASSADKMIKSFGNEGNTVGTRLPKNGAPKGVKRK